MRVSQGLKAAIAVAAVVALTAPALSHAAYPGKNGKLAIEGDTRPGIWTVKPNGDALKRLTGKKGFPFNPSWSPNGRWIAFTRSGSLWKMRANGSHRHRLVRGVPSDVDGNISWSPNGRKLVFDKKEDLWTVHANGTKAKPIAKTADVEASPAWSPKGGAIAFQFRDAVTADTELRLIKPNGTGETSIPNTKNGAEPDWSPNGNRLAYQAPGTGIVLIKPDGMGQRIFQKNGKYFVGDPAWSPDGKQIAYAHNRGTSNTQIARKPVAGGKEHVVIRRHHWFSPSWQPVR